MSDIHELCKTDCLVNMPNLMEKIFDNYCQSKDVEGFLNLQGRLELLALKDKE